MFPPIQAAPGVYGICCDCPALLAVAVPLAKVTPPEGYSAQLHAVTTQTVVIEDRGKWWVSIDAGRSWRSAADSVARTAVDIPAAGRLHTRCADANCDNRALTVIDPDTNDTDDDKAAAADSG